MPGKTVSMNQPRPIAVRVTVMEIREAYRSELAVARIDYKRVRLRDGMKHMSRGVGLWEKRA